MTLGDFFARAVPDLLQLYPRNEANNLAEILVEEVLGIPHYYRLAHPGFQISFDTEPVLEDYLRRLACGEPLQYVLGFADFYSRRFKVSPEVLIPRPETELLVGKALSFINGRNHLKVLDLCTGSGCIAWTLAMEVPGLDISALDISKEALQIAKVQDLNPVSSPKFILGDVFDTSLASSLGKFDLIVSNPPYVMDSQRSSMRKNVTEWEPENAIFVRDDDPLSFYRAIEAWAESSLVPGGGLIIEINDLLEKETSRIFSEEIFENKEVINGLDGLPRHIFLTRKI